MATEPLAAEPRPSAPARIVRKAAEPVRSRRGRLVAATAVVGATLAMAPTPVDAVGVAALVGVVWEIARR
jgi:hypothetical protein